MSERTEKQEFYFRKSKDNGDIGGTTQEMEVPVFDWESFKNLPTAELFVRRAYRSLLQKLVRDIKLGNKNGTTTNDIQSLEAVITRSFNFKKKDIEKWCDERDWNTPLIKSPDSVVPALKDLLPEYAYSHHAIPEEKRTKVAHIIADVADRKKDDIAEYLWVKLTQPLPEEDCLLERL